MSFAVVGSAEKFTPSHHAYRVYRLLRELGVEVYPVVADTVKLGKDKVYPSLIDLPHQVTTAIPCLPSNFALSIVQDCHAAGIPNIWFQPHTLSAEAAEFCHTYDLKIIDGCTLKYFEFNDVTRFFHPCYWHAKTIRRKQLKL